MLHLVSQLMKYMRIHRKFWLGPLVTILLMLGGLVVLAQTSSVAPFIYAIF